MEQQIDDTALKLAIGLLDLCGVRPVGENVHFDKNTYSVHAVKIDLHLETLAEALNLILPLNKVSINRPDALTATLSIGDEVLMVFNRPVPQSEMADHWFYRCYEHRSYKLCTVMYMRTWHDKPLCAG